MSSVADYVGRTFDVLVFHGVTPGREVAVKQTLYPDDLGGYIVTGIEKLVQQFLLILLTELGSVTHLPIYGTRFMADARSGRWRTAIDVRQSFAAAVVDVKRQLARQETSTTPDDERFALATLLGITLDGTSVFVSVEVLSVAGLDRKLIVPVAVILKEARS
jgi:hypothetical protein